MASEPCVLDPTPVISGSSLQFLKFGILRKSGSRYRGVVRKKVCISLRVRRYSRFIDGKFCMGNKGGQGRGKLDRVGCV